VFIQYQLYVDFDQLGDWFESLADILHWNLRKAQSNLDTDQLIAPLQNDSSPTEPSQTN